MTSNGPILLDCTIRDGSYAIDFKFTAADTALIASRLDLAGLPYVEIGHGLGLGASEAGQGASASHDLEVIEATRARVDRARIGAFFIPGIGSADRLREAAERGLDFVRVGQNADEMDAAWPVVELARELGLEVFVNLMKSYGIPTADFAEVAHAAEQAGARGVYVVDSAGGMFPDEVRGYVTAALERAERIAVGFHGHSNLHLAVANSLAAYDAGATFIDTSVWGIGRSSGNVPTEVMAAVFDRLGIDCGIAALDIIDLAETYLRPLAEHLHPHDMTAVSLGYGRFHSSYLSRALDAAAEAGVNPFRLIVALGHQDTMRLPDELLARTVEELRGEGREPETSSELARFSQAGFGPRQIRTGDSALGELLDGLGVVAAKRNVAIVLDLAPATALPDDGATAEFVAEDEQMALGRIRFGSVDALAKGLEGRATAAELFLLDLEGIDPPASSRLTAEVRAAIGGRIVPYRSQELELAYLGEVAMSVLAARGGTSLRLHDPGVYAPAAVEALRRRLAGIVSVVGAGQEEPDLLVVVGPPGPESESSPRVPGLYLGRAGLESDEPRRKGELIVLERAGAYLGHLSRWRRAVAAGDSLTARETLA